MAKNSILVDKLLENSGNRIPRNWEIEISLFDAHGEDPVTTGLIDITQVGDTEERMRFSHEIEAAIKAVCDKWKVQDFTISR